MDREKVIKGLETCIPMKYETNEEKECRHEQCPYGRENYKPMNGCFWDLMSDALALLKEDCHNCKLECLLQKYDELKEKYDALLKDQEHKDRMFHALEEDWKRLKEQEAVKPKSKVRHGANAQIQHFCGNCNSMLHGKPKFCSECGKAVKWK